MNFEYISSNSSHLRSVIELGKKNSSTLGFMPEGGFIDHAKKGHILVATENSKLIGYVLFRIALRTNILSVTHLCINDRYRNKKIAVRLLDNLKSKYKHSLAGILLSCREDYVRPAKLWREYGFVAKNKIRSRSLEEKYLIKWWYSFNQIDLFTIYNDEKKHTVGLDMNIIIKLRENNGQNYDEVKFLLADWLVDEVDYYYAQEVYNEIIRDRNNERAKKTKSFIEMNFLEAKSNQDDSKKIFENIKEYFKNNRINDYSDIKQVSDCIASNLSYFITLDKKILNSKNYIEENYDIVILSPEEFILKIDMLINNNNYYPRRLSGATHITKKLTSDDINLYANKFLKNDIGETMATFQSKIKFLIQNWAIANIVAIEDKHNSPMAIWGYILEENKIEIKFIRTLQENLEITLFTQIIFEIINTSINEEKNLIVINDDNFCEFKSKILLDFGFTKSISNWKKATIKDLLRSTELLKKYPFLNEFFDNKLSIMINDVNIGQKMINLYKIERILYPLKFQDLDIPCYIIPIKRYWAGQLFDKYNTNEDLFGASPDKIWNRENVYYRSIIPVNEKFPARVLWYVSAQKNHSRQKSILATSYIDSVSVDNVKIQFRKFKKYGIYEWEDIYKLADRNDKSKIKAIQFSDTEVFKKEISFSNITNILVENNLKKNTFVSPLQISNKVFNDIYQLILKD